MATKSTMNHDPRRLRQWFSGQSRPVKVIIVAVLLAIGWFGYSKFFGTAKTTAAYQTAPVTRGTLVVSLTNSGTVSSANSASVTTDASGVVSKIFAPNGQKVRSGDPIIQLDLDQTSLQRYQQANATYESAKNSLASAQSALYTLQNTLFNTNQKLINDAVARDLTVDDPTYIQENAAWLAAEANYKNQQNVIAQNQTDLSSAWLSLNQVSPVVYAPISGTVNGLSVQTGSVIAATSGSSNSTTTTTGQKIANILTEATPTIAVNLSEIDAPNVRVEDKATVTFDAFTGKTFTGKIVSIDTVGAISSGVTNYPTIIQLDTPVAGLYPNMSAQANIITAVKDNVLLVPTGAVQTQNGTSTVQVLGANNQTTSITVETGLSSDTQVEITSGLAEGQTVITGSSSTAGSTTGTSLFGGGLGGGFGALRGGGGGGGANRGRAD
jgi:macrolide-specific efflux system membrane fusion protein